MGDLISAVSTAITLTNRLREISKNIGDAEFKSLLADLNLELADAKLKIADLVAENASLKEKLHCLTSASGERCPKCNGFSRSSARPEKLGVEEDTVKEIFKHVETGPPVNAFDGLETPVMLRDKRG